MYMICTYKILFSCEFLPFVRVSLFKAFLNISVYFSKKPKKKNNHKLTMFKLMVVFSFSFFFTPSPRKKCKMLFVKNFQNPQRKLAQIKL